MCSVVSGACCSPVMLMGQALKFGLIAGHLGSTWLLLGQFVMTEDWQQEPQDSYLERHDHYLLSLIDNLLRSKSFSL